MTRRKGKPTGKTVSVMKRRCNAADLLTHTRPVTPDHVQHCQKTIEELQELLEGRTEFKVLRCTGIHSKEAPDGHRDAFPTGRGVREDGIAVMAVVVEYRMWEV